MKKILNYISGVMPYFIAELILVLVYRILTLLYRKGIEFKIGAELEEGGRADSARFSQAVEEAMSQEVLYLLSAIAVLVCGVVFFLWYRQETRFEVRRSLRHVFTRKNVGLLLLLGVGCQFLFSGAMSLIQPYLTQIFTDYAETVGEITAGNKIVVLFLVVFVGPIVEELIFRGVILQKTSKVISFMGANILQAFLFGIYHWNIVQGIYATLIGFVFGLICYKYKTIYAPILLHILINASSLLAVRMPYHLISHVIMVVVGGAFVVISLYMLKIFPLQRLGIGAEQKS